MLGWAESERSFITSGPSVHVSGTKMSYMLLLVLFSILSFGFLFFHVHHLCMPLLGPELVNKILVSCILYHRLKIETGRYIKLDRSERLCDKCSAGSVEDEQHFLIEFSKFNEYRNNLFQTVNCNNKNFSKLDNFQKFFWLLTNEDSDILHKMGLYLHEHLK